jgi:hypothetical protein
VPRVFTTPPKTGTNRFKIQQLNHAANPKYAVFLRAASGQSAKFQALHETPESALETARFHAAETASHGNLDFTYYVIEIKHRVGIERGKLVDEPMD